MWGKELEELYNYSKEKGIVIASYAGLAPLTKEPEGPLKKILPEIRERVQKAYGGHTVTEGQILLKWLKQKNILIVTWVFSPLLAAAKLSLIFGGYVEPRARRLGLRSIWIP